MKKIFTFLTLFLLTTNFWASSETMIYIGDANSTSYTNISPPWNLNWKNSISQTIYLEEEMQTEGIITKIGYSFRGHGDIPSSRNVQFYMASISVDKAFFTSSTDWIPHQDFTLVYNGAFPVNTSGIGDVTITLDTPYDYSGGNLVIMSTRDIDPPADPRWNINNGFQVTTGWFRSMLSSSDTVDLQPGNWGTGGRNDNVPNLRLYFSTDIMGGIEGYVELPPTPLREGGIEGVTIELLGMNRTTETDNSGYFFFANITPDTYEIQASKIGFYDKYETDIVVQAGQTTTVNITMSEIPKFSISGIVVSSMNNLPLSGASVELTGYDLFPIVTTNSIGEFQINEVFAGQNYVLTIKATGFIDTVYNIQMEYENLYLNEIFIYSETLPPTNVVAVINADVVNITWVAPAQSILYNVYRVNSFQSIETAELLVPNHGMTSFTDTTWVNVPQYETYRYIIRAVYSNNNLSEPAFSNSLFKSPDGTIYIGNPESTNFVNNVGFTLNWRNSLSQTIYRKEDISLEGLITDITYVYNSLGDISHPISVAVYLANIPVDTVVYSGNFSWIPFEQFTLVYDGFVEFNLPAGVHYLNIPLQEQYLYSGENLAIYTLKRFNGQANGDFANGFLATNHNLQNRTITIETEGSQPYNPAEPPGGYLHQHQANILLFFSSDGTGHLTGNVKSNANDTPLPDVEISLLGTNRIVYTNSEGNFTLNYINEGVISISAKKTGFNDYINNEITIFEGATTEIAISMIPLSTVSISGRVIASDNNQPLIGANVKLTGYAEIGPVTTDNLGIFTLSGVHVNQSYNLVVTASNYVETTYEIDVYESDINLNDIFIYEMAYPARNVTANLEGFDVRISWDSPLSATRLNNSVTYTLYRETSNSKELPPTPLREGGNAMELPPTPLREGGRTVLAENLSSLEYIDTEWQNLEMGTYHYIVYAVYPNNNISEPATSNRLTKNLPGYVHIGNAQSNQTTPYFPITASWETGVSQIIYHEQEIPYRGYITELRFTFSGNGNSPANAIYNLYLSITDKLEFANTTDWVPYNDFTNVFSGTLPLTGLTGRHEITIPFNEPFLYTGGNLVVMGHKEFLNIMASGNNWIFSPTPNSFRVLYYIALDNSIYLPVFPTGYRETNIANLGLHFNVLGMGSLLGTVSTNVGETISDVEIIVNGEYTYKGFTNENGVYFFNYLPEGIIEIIASKHGYFNSVESDVIINANQTTSKNITLHHIPTVQITGRVISSDTQQGLQNAKITLSGYDRYETLSNNQGLFTINNVYTEFTYSLQIISDGHSVYEDSFIEVTSSDLDLGDIVLYERANPPRNVTAELIDNSAVITWNKPYIGNETWITHLNNEIFNFAVGREDQAAFHAIPLHRFTQENLQNAQATGGDITKIAFRLEDVNATISIVIYTGGSINPINPGTLSYSQIVEGAVPNQMTEFELTTPFTLPDTGEVWIGYEIYASGGSPISMGGEPQNTMFGDIIYWGPTDSWLNYGIRGDYNWMIKAFVQGADNNTVLSSTRSLESYSIYRVVNSEATIIQDNVLEEMFIDLQWSTLPNANYYYQVEAVYTMDNISEAAISNLLIKDDTDDDLNDSDIPIITILNSNFPNPFNPTTTISFDIAKEGNVNINIYNIRGQHVKTLVNEHLNVGKYSIEWHGTDNFNRDVASGVYFYQMKFDADNYGSIRKMLLLK